jgi:arylsulfatase A
VIVGGGPAPASARPNIVMILADDVGLPGIGAYGSDRYVTPRIDSLGDTGIIFNNGYVHPKCGPSRRALTSGQYPFRNAASGWGKQDTRYAQKGRTPFLEDYLKEAGYATCYLGKPDGGTSNLDAWDEWVGTPNGTDFWPEAIRDNGATIAFANDTNADPRVGSGAAARYVDYSPEYLNDYALDWIERAAANPQPFYLYYSMNLLHVATRSEHNYQPTPHSDPLGQALGESEGAWQQRCMDDMNAYMDYQVGTLLDKLDALGIRDNTLVVYVGDNGGNLDSTVDGGRQVVGGKNSLEDGGSHCPFLLSWPGRIPEGFRSDHLVQIQDLLPTFVELAGGTLPTGMVIDGHSFAPLLLGRPFTPRSYVYSEYKNDWFVRNLGYRLDKDGDFWDVTDAPFTKTAVDPASSPEAQAAYDFLSATLAGLDPVNNNPIREWADDSEANTIYFTAFKDVHFKGHLGQNADSISGDAADPDGDNWPNLFEMAYSTDPQSAASAPPVTAAQAAGFALGDDVSPSPHVRVERVEAVAPPAFGTVHITLSGSGNPILRATRTSL